MITLEILGLDQYVVGHISGEATAKLAAIYGCEEDLINFYSPNSMIIHKGVEQTSWNTIVIVRAPKKFEKAEEAVASYILEVMKKVSINIEVEFEYFEEAKHYQYINESYPRYIAGENIKTEVEIETEEPEEGEEVYLGNAFDGFQELLDKKYGK
ncbi:MAG: hypothetical protein MJ239_06720 [Bacilli bacterium]|nr:hypothetical protein [Bacilli bacterium]